MEVSLEPYQIDNISRMNESCIIEDNSIYEECCICCESFKNKSFINECLHPFCFQCIIDWTKVKAVCPLCVRPITRILHNIRSQDDYDVEDVIPPGIDVLANINSEFIAEIDDTDTDSYGGMESMDMESEYDSYHYNYDSEYSHDSDFILHDNDNFSDHNLGFYEHGSVEEDNEDTGGNPPEIQANDHEDQGDDSSVHSLVELLDSDKDENLERSEENYSSGHSSDGDDDTNDYYNTVSDIEDEHVEDDFDCDSGDDEDDADADAEDENESNPDYFFEVPTANDYGEYENDLESFDGSDNNDEDGDYDASDDDDDYYYSDRY